MESMKKQRNWKTKTYPTYVTVAKPARETGISFFSENLLMETMLKST